MNPEAGKARITNTSRRSSERRTPRVFRKWRWGWLLIGVLALVHAGLALDCAKRVSITHDEYWHLPIGLLHWRTGQFDFDRLNPPLIRMWAALPLLATDARSDTTRADLLRYGDQFLVDNTQHYHHCFFLGRAMIVLLSVMTGLILARWAQRLFGMKSACLAALLWFSDPTVLAHGALVTTDMGTALFFVWTLYWLWRWAIRSRWRDAVGFGLLLGLAQLAKYTCVLLLPVSVVLWFVWRRPPFCGSESDRNRFVSRRVVLAQWSVALSLALFTVNAGYLGHGTGTALGQYQFHSHTLQAITGRLNWLAAMPVLLPRDYVLGLDEQQVMMEGEHPVFLDNTWSTRGFFAYYVMAMAYKLPHSTQLLFVLSLLTLPLRDERTGRRYHDLWWLFAFVVLLAIASSTHMQLGIRYILPGLPLFFLFAARCGCLCSWGRHRLISSVVGVAAILALASLRYHPDHLAYFNEWAGGPAEGRWHLLDSNLDWGQDLERLSTCWLSRSADEIGLAYFGTVPPASLGIRYHLPPHKPTPGWYVISVNLTMGRPFAVRTPNGQIVKLSLDELGYFRFFKPVARIGYSLDVFLLTDLDVAEWNETTEEQADQ